LNMALISAGVEVTVTDESQYVAAQQGSVPAIIIATAQNKIKGLGSGTATGTTAANAGNIFLVSSQRELIEIFGNPSFYNSAVGTPIHGYELNEYGLLAAYSILGISNRAYVLRADVDLGELAPSASRPTGAPSNGTIWMDVSTDTRWAFSSSLQAQVHLQIKFQQLLPVLVI